MALRGTVKRRGNVDGSCGQGGGKYLHIQSTLHSAVPLIFARTLRTVVPIFRLGVIQSKLTQFLSTQGEGVSPTVHFCEQQEAAPIQQP